MYENDLLGISNLKDANINLIYIGRAVRHMLISQDEATRDAAVATIKRAREKMMLELTEGRKRIFRPEVIARYEQFERDLTKALEAFEKVVGMIQREKINPSAAAQFITSAEFVATIAAADNGLQDLSLLKEKSADSSLQQARMDAARTQQIAILLLIAGVVMAGLLGVLIGLSIQRPNDRVRQSVEALVAGQVDTPIAHLDYPNEIGVMARAIGVLQDIYRKANEQHWVKAQVSEISTLLQQAQDFSTLTQTAVSKVAPAVGAGHGAFYVADAQGQFNMLASYGYRERKNLSNIYQMGEGLVGQCAMERAPIMLTAPQNYIRINSGLGEGPPACVQVQPIVHNGRVLGVLEMASFATFTEREKAVIEALIPVLATSMEILDRNLRTKELLTATQEQAERMEKQAAQLEEQTVEMEAQQAELMETEHWFRSIIEAAPDGMLVADMSDHIVLVNPMAERMLGYAPGELVNVNFTRLLPALSLTGEHSVVLTTTHAQCKQGAMLLLDVSCTVLPQRGGRGKCVSVALRPHAQTAPVATV